MAQSPALRTEYLVSGTRTPPARRNSKLATLGRIFKPWKWRKKKSDKLKHSPAGLERKSNTKQNREEIIKKGLLEIADKAPDAIQCQAEDATAETLSNLPSPTSQPPTPEETLQDISSSTTVSSSDEDQQIEEEPGKIPMTLEEELKDSVEKTLQALLLTQSLESPPLERNATLLNSPPLLPMPPPKVSTWMNQCVPGVEMEEVTSPPASIMKNPPTIGSSHISGHTNLFQPSLQKATENNGPVVKGQNPTPTGSPHLPAMHMPLPPSRVIEELHRALATKHRQDSFHSREVKSSPKKRVEFRTSRTSSVEKSRDSTTDSDCENRSGSEKEAEENKENLIRDSSHKDEVLLYDDDELDSSLISGTLQRKYKKEVLAVKLRNRPSKQELEDRNIFPRRTDEERQKIRQQIEIKLSKRWSLLSHCVVSLK